MIEQKDRMGASFERLVADVFSRIGFRVKLNIFTNKENGQKSEQDILAEKGNLKILVQCKDYTKFPEMKMEETIQDLIEDGDSMGANKLVLAIIGLKDSNKWRSYAEEKGIYLWNENYWRKLQNLDLYDLILEVGKNLEIEEILRRISKEEEKNLKSIYENIESIKDPKRRKLIFQELERIELSDETKKRVKLKKIGNEILLEKEREIEELKRKLEEQGKERVEDFELAERFRKINEANLDNHKKYLVLDKIIKKMILSAKSKSILNWEEIDTWIKKLQEDSDIEKGLDERLVILEEKRKNGKISFKEYSVLKEKAKEIGASKRGILNAEIKSFDYDLNKAIFKKKLIKIAVSLGVLTIIFITLWRFYFKW